MSLPAIFTRPVVAGLMPAKTRIRVDLPTPLTPIRAVMVPGCTSRLMPETITRRPMEQARLSALSAVTSHLRIRSCGDP